jgi:(2Fe-2S) ferredoxin
MPDARYGSVAPLRLEDCIVAKPTVHLFVCQNSRAPENPRGSCQGRGSAAVLEAFKRRVVERGLRLRLEFDGCTCVDTCAWGPVVVIYPQGIWYGKVTCDDVDAIIEAAKDGSVVEQLLIPEEAIRRS